MGNNRIGLRFLACRDYALYVFNSMHCQSKCSDCCEWSGWMLSPMDIACSGGRPSKALNSKAGDFHLC